MSFNQFILKGFFEWSRGMYLKFHGGNVTSRIHARTSSFMLGLERWPTWSVTSYVHTLTQEIILTGIDCKVELFFMLLMTVNCNQLCKKFIIQPVATVVFISWSIFFFYIVKHIVHEFNFEVEIDLNEFFFCKKWIIRNSPLVFCFGR